MQGTESHRIPETLSRPLAFGGRERVTLGGMLDERGAAEAPASAAAPKLRENFLASFPGSPTSWGPGPRVPRGCRGRGGQGRLRNAAARGWTRGGRRAGADLKLSRGTQRSHHRECGMDRRRRPIGAQRHCPRPSAAANGGRAVGWAGPRCTESGAPSAFGLPPTARR